MRVFRHPTEDVLRVDFDGGEGGIVEIDLRYTPADVTEAEDVPRDWIALDREEYQP